MYTPPAFREDDPVELHRLIREARLSTLVTATPAGIMAPPLPLTAFKTGREVPEDWPSTRWPTWTPFTYPFNMTGQPGLSVPCGFHSQGLPIGLQLVGARFNDALVLRAGHAYQQAAPLTDRRPALFAGAKE